MADNAQNNKPMTVESARKIVDQLTKAMDDPVVIESIRKHIRSEKRENLQVYLNCKERLGHLDAILSNSNYPLTMTLGDLRDSLIYQKAKYEKLVLGESD